MYKGSKSVVSTLCYGVQWDAALQFIATKDADYPKNSEGKGNYTDNLLETGSSEEYAVNNIYDMAGNVWEKTMEVYSTALRVHRGDFYGSDLYYPASDRFRDFPYGVSSGIGFRVTLYIK